MPFWKKLNIIKAPYFIHPFNKSQVPIYCFVPGSRFWHRWSWSLVSLRAMHRGRGLIQDCKMSSGMRVEVGQCYVKWNTHMSSFLHKWDNTMIPGQYNVNRSDMHHLPPRAIKLSTEDYAFYLHLHCRGRQGFRAEQNHMMKWAWMPEWLHGTETLRSDLHYPLISARGKLLLDKTTEILELFGTVGCLL